MYVTVAQQLFQSEKQGKKRKVFFNNTIGGFEPAQVQRHKWEKIREVCYRIALINGLMLDRRGGVVTISIVLREMPLIMFKHGVAR